MKARSRQGFRVALIGVNQTAQTACTQYLTRSRDFKRMNMNDALKRFLKTSYWSKERAQVDWRKLLVFYDSVYKVENDIFIKYMRGRVESTGADIIIPDVRYLNEMEALIEMGFIICRVTTPVKQLQIDKYVMGAEGGTVAVSMKYDKRFSTNHGANYSVHWTSKATTGALMDAFLERIGYKFDI